MNTEQAIEFLEQNQPMASDTEITQVECNHYLEILSHFEQNPDDRCVSLLINSVGANTGLGMYEKIGDVLLTQNRDVVTNELKFALANSTESVKYRCCWWAADLDIWGVAELIWPLRSSKNEDLKEAAEAYIKLKHENV
tara:strand:+ start:162 stop:578 length:417 start_codon:yes stop_codon:yes gene_type:complete